MRIRLSYLVVVAAVLCCATVTSAQAPGRTTVAMPPNAVKQPSNVAGKPAENFLLDARPLPGTPTNDAVTSFVMDLVRGLRIDRRALPKLCTAAQAARIACPAASKVGRGFVQATVSGYLQPGGSFQVFVLGDAHLGVPTRRGDIAAIYIEGTEGVTGQRGVISGRILRIARPQFGIEVRFDDLPSQIPFGQALSQFAPGVAIAGVTVSVDELRLRTQTFPRTVRGVTHNFITNPPRCRNSAWPWELRIALKSGLQVQRGTIKCRAR